MDISSLTLAVAFAAGLISFLSPCVLPLVPGYLSYIAGQSPMEKPGSGRLATHRTSLLLSGFFVLGFSVIFISLGASATLLGSLLARYRYETNIIGGVIIILFGLYMTGLLNASWLGRWMGHDTRFQVEMKGGRSLSAFVLGLAFAFGWTPCIGPILGAILTLSATAATTHAGISLLSSYSAGLGLPFILAALFSSALSQRMQRLQRFSRVLYITAGTLMIVMGIAMITGYLSRFAVWLLNTFPILATIG